MTLLYQIHSKLFVPPLGRFSPLFNLSSREPENQRKFKFKTKLKIQSYTKHLNQCISVVPHRQVSSIYMFYFYVMWGECMTSTILSLACLTHFLNLNISGLKRDLSNSKQDVVLAYSLVVYLFKNNLE